MWDAAIATIALPLGTVGGVTALRILGLFVFQPLDLLTMIGFIIVLGLVVNNTILLVARTRQAEAEGMSRVDAVRSSLETRLRPIFSSTLTAIFGMLPLVLVPGPGAEIYRGLGAVIVGGILVSHVFTLILMPAMLRLGEQPAVAAPPPYPQREPQHEYRNSARARAWQAGSPLAVLVIGFAFGRSLLSGERQGRRPRQAKAPPAPLVTVAIAKRVEMAPKMALPGTVVARDDSKLASEVEGRVAWVAEVGTKVASGDVIARIDPDVARMQLASDKANVARLQASLHFNRDQAARMNKLLAANAIAKATRDQAVSKRDMTAAELAQAEVRAGQIAIPIRSQRNPRALPRPRRGASDQHRRICNARQGHRAPRRYRLHRGKDPGAHRRRPFPA